MKPKVEITLVHEEGLLEDVVLGFTTLEQIDSFIATFEEMRADLEHQIEMEKQRKRDKRKRAKMRRKLDDDGFSKDANVEAINERLKRWFDKQEGLAKSFVKSPEKEDENSIKFFDEEIKIDDDVLRKEIFNGFMKELKEIDKIKLPKKEEIEEAFEEIKQTFDKIDDSDKFKMLLKPYVELAEALIKMDK